MTKYLFLLFLIFPLLSQSQDVPKDTSLLLSKQLVKKDTVVILQRRDEQIIKDYQQILEKTNEQLSLWSNPYGLFVGMLGVLFAVLAIIAVFVLYRQSKEYKDLINKSLQEHRLALDKLLAERNNQLDIYNASIDKSIMEYKEQLKTENEDTQKQIKEFISKLEEQKEYIDTQIHTYKHSGWHNKDIPVSYHINSFTIFNSKITLNDINQSFTIYMRVKTNDNNQIWLGFAGNNGKIIPYKSNDEYTLQQNYNEQEIIIHQNIVSFFNAGFPKLNSYPIQVDCIRLRGSRTDFREITFSFKII